jgi:hypothetical protein
VLRVPLLIKAGAGPAGLAPTLGTRLAGVCDGIGLVLTFLEVLQLSVPDDLPALGRWRHVGTGAPIPEHDSFTWIRLEMYGAMVPLARHHAPSDSYSRSSRRETRDREPARNPPGDDASAERHRLLERLTDEEPRDTAWVGAVPSVAISTSFSAPRSL